MSQASICLRDFLQHNPHTTAFRQITIQSHFQNAFPYLLHLRHVLLYTNEDRNFTRTRSGRLGHRLSRTLLRNAGRATAAREHQEARDGRPAVPSLSEPGRLAASVKQLAMQIRRYVQL